VDTDGTPDGCKGHKNGLSSPNTNKISKLFDLGQNQRDTICCAKNNNIALYIVHNKTLAIGESHAEI
jgi:hypothetical protein